MTIGNRPTLRADGRVPTQLRPISFELGVQKWAEGSCIIRVGDTQVLCAASIVDRVPPHLRGKGTGWVTAEYSMLPRATAERTDRESVKGKLGGRTHEIQRLIGRSLRDAVDLTRLGERTITVDCDVLQADGGTRTASITGGYVALAAALITYGMDRHLVARIAAVSVGLVDGEALLDLDYSEDSRADVDFNVVGTDAGTFVEVQGTAEGKPFDRAGDGGADGSRHVRPRAPLRRPGRGPRDGEALTMAGPRPRLLIATRSAHKLAELRELLSLDRGELVTLDDLGVEGDVDETGATFEANARLKARFGARATGLPTLADDSGLEVDALGGGPGVRTRRYAGENATDMANNAKLLAALAGLPPERRGRALRLPARPRPAGRGRPARRPARSGRPRDVSRPYRERTARHGRLRLRPDLRAGSGASRRADARAVDPGGEEPDLPSRGGGPADDPDPPRARLLGVDAPGRALRRICVFCGASVGRDPRYAEVAAAVGGALARRGIELVYGGGRLGLMGAVADGALAAGGTVIGVIPAGLVDRELAHTGVSDLRIVTTLHERKAVMAELSDAFLALPGGLGTLEELAEVLSWAQLEIHAKPVGALDVGGFFGPLVAYLDHAAREGFVPPRHRDLLIVDEDLDRLLERFAAWQSPGGRWP